MGIEDTIRGFIIRELGWRGRDEELDDAFPLTENKVLDSMGIFKLVSFLENEYRIEIDDEELVPQNFSTIGAVAALVRSKQ